jgi:monothiol glutaredoxin
MSAAETIKSTIDGNDVVLFMKGTKMMPQCGFSSRVAGVLNYMGVNFADVNVLADPDIRQGIKDFPTGRRSRSFTSRANSSAAATSSPR